MVRPNLRSYCLILDPIPNLIVSTGFAVISPKTTPFTYLYNALTTEDFIGYLTTHASGSAYPAVKTDDFINVNIIKPNNNVLVLFHKITKPIYKIINKLFLKNINLRQTRDLLLPKLISGELDVSELKIKIKDN